MGKPAARLTDMHVCPMVTPGTPPIPHVGGPVVGPGTPTVLIGGMPAAVMGDMCVCTGPPDSIILGSTGVMIGGKPAARMGDSTAHGGTITLGCPTVLIGEVSPGGPVTNAPPQVMMELFDNVANQEARKAAIKESAAFATAASRIDALQKGAIEGAETVHKHNEEDCKVQYKVTSKEGNPAKDVKYEIQTNDGKVVKGKTGADGMTQQLSGYTEGMCTLSFPD
jgi:uncharacterized Zn-binding protein involved in type VI secretion